VSQAAPPQHGRSQRPVLKPNPPAHDGVLPGAVRSPVPSLKLPGSNTPTVRGLPVGTINVSALQQFLKSKGYDLRVDGSLGPQTRAAMANYGVGKLPPKYGAPAALTAALHGMTHAPTGLTPQQFNQHYGTPKTKSVVTSPVSQTLDQHGNTVQGGNGAPVDLRGLNAIAAQMGDLIPTQLADQLANNAAGLQFDPQIHDVQTQIAQNPRQAAQSQHDIADWYGQVQGAQHTATTRDHAISSAGIDSQKQALAAIISSIGGSANEGSASVGAAGENNIGTLQALGGIQDQYNQDLAPLLKLAQSGAASGQQVKDQNALTALNSQLGDLQGQRGQTQAATRAQTIMQILTQNNATKQQGFTNRLNVAAAGEAAQLNGLKVLTQYAKANAAPGTFASASPTDLSHVATSIKSFLLDNTGVPLPGMTPAKAISIARNVGGTFFPRGGIPIGWAQGVVNQLLPTAAPARVGG
jgi:hypothetical protein